ncbi:MAG TPA: DUF2167 domain-containing protein [Albitalea sp.]|nr:DUF2167 domain-containing protein [Albitalea sp.]
MFRYATKTGLATLAMAASMLAPACAASQDAEAARNEMRQLPWQHGPVTGAVGSVAQLKVPAEAALLAESSGGRFLELTGNPPSPGNTILVNGNWFAVFKFRDEGYVKDDEKIDADGLLKALQDSDGPANEERRKLGLDELHTDGWAVRPHYDARTKFLEWGVRLHSGSDPHPVINYTMRLLSRRGHEAVILVTEPDTLDKDVNELRGLLTTGFAFNPGERYDEFKPGDHVAEYGLGALVLGGAAAAAIKGGWWKGIVALLAAGWKLIAAAVVAGFAAIGKLFRRRAGDQ